MLTKGYLKWIDLRSIEVDMTTRLERLSRFIGTEITQLPGDIYDNLVSYRILGFKPWNLEHRTIIVSVEALNDAVNEGPLRQIMNLPKKGETVNLNFPLTHIEELLHTGKMTINSAMHTEVWMVGTGSDEVL